VSPATLYLVKQVESAIRAHLDDVVGVEGVTAGQYTAMTAVQRHPGITVTELARVSFVRPQTMTQMVASLEESGLLARGEANGRRSRTVALTERGSGILGRLVPPVTELEERMLADFSATARTEIRGALTAMRSALEAARPPE